MPSNNKCFIHNTVVDVCFRTEEGLPLVARPFMRAILVGILAQAQNMYPVKLCSIVVMGNHVHMLLVVVDPSAVPEFVGYVKRESAHAINDLLGRKQRTVWHRRYDSPVIGSLEAVINRLVYHYTNPQRAGLVEQIEDYPNFNTWEYLLSGRAVIKTKRIRRKEISPKFPNEFSGQGSISEEYRLEEEPEELELVIDPNAWIDCYEESRGIDPVAINKKIISAVRKAELELSKNRIFPVLGAEKLLQQDMLVSHAPKAQGRKMIIIDTVKERLKAFISFFKSQQEYARAIRKQREIGDYEAVLPCGFFLSGGRMLSSMLFSSTPLCYAYG